MVGVVESYFFAAYDFSNASSAVIVYKYMSTSPNDRDEHQVPPKTSSTVILLLLTMGDTAWRMFIPVIGLLVLGLLVDHELGTKPWITIVGLILGIILAALLVKRQFNKVKQ